ncbi:complement C1q tumor necrosis factor-related protein 7-like [Saccostrea echinata]|uniref:complement C1q tumor necrosis factor-related protein 7-like n=1 Tax=Saccostrea echinata TaxID=191078 RepID=UPI002A7FDD1E|nr:complement C1q tumor necrosis factor-related protein 7-like [Saccostrea echinata]
MVGFYAIMSKGMTNPGTHQTLIFDKVQLNAGNGYQPHSGVFIAPATGMYAFTWTMRLHTAHGPEHHSTQLIVDNNMYSAVYLSVGNSGNENVSGTCVVLLNKGDDVFVRTTSANGGGIESDGSGVTAFGGWLIK